MNEQETLAMVPAIITRSYDDTGYAMTVAVDLSSLGVPHQWEYDCVIAAEDGEVTLLLYPPEQ
jgi:hypothetical protein